MNQTNTEVGIMIHSYITKTSGLRHFPVLNLSMLIMIARSQGTFTGTQYQMAAAETKVMC